MNHVQPVRKGMIAQPDLVIPGMVPIPGHPVGYGGVWLYQKKKRSQCKGYDDAVRKYEKALAQHKKKGCFKRSFVGIRRSKCKDTAGRMREAERTGKAAWKTCKAYVKGEQKGHTQIDTSGGYSVTGATGGGMIDPITGLPLDPGMATFQPSGEEEGGGSGALWAGVGVLLVATGGLIVYKRRQKGKRK